MHMQLYRDFLDFYLYRLRIDAPWPGIRTLIVNALGNILGYRYRYRYRRVRIVVATVNTQRWI